jgi:hypothetical protein
MSQEKRIKIAEALGATWKEVHGVQILSFCQWDTGPKRWDLGDGRVLASDIPNYFVDLNACHIMEEHLDLNDEMFHIYRAELYRVTPRQFTLPDRARWNGCAPPENRCEAFGKTLGLW